MKKLFFTLGAILAFGIASAQIKSQPAVPGQVNTSNSANTARPQDMAISRNANALPAQSGATINSSNNSIPTPTALASPAAATAPATQTAAQNTAATQSGTTATTTGTSATGTSTAPKQ